MQHQDNIQPKRNLFTEMIRGFEARMQEENTLQVLKRGDDKKNLVIREKRRQRLDEERKEKGYKKLRARNDLLNTTTHKNNKSMVIDEQSSDLKHMYLESFEEDLVAEELQHKNPGVIKIRPETNLL